MKGGLLMITWLELFTFCLVIIGVVSLVIQVYKKK
jgi:Na+/proline symporter